MTARGRGLPPAPGRPGRAPSGAASRRGRKGEKARAWPPAAAGPARIEVEVRASRGFARHRAALRRLARATLEGLGSARCELSIALVGDDEMQALNASYRGVERPTDVLAFALGEGEGGAPPGLLGDVVISVPTAARQAAERGTSLERELAALLVHGVLHLLGYDHERSAAEARRMRARERELLEGPLAPLMAGPRAGARRGRTARPRGARARPWPRSRRTRARPGATPGRATPAGAAGSARLRP